MTKKPNESYDRCRSLVKHRGCILLKNIQRLVNYAYCFEDQEESHQSHEKLTKCDHLTEKIACKVTDRKTEKLLVEC